MTDLPIEVIESAHPADLCVVLWMRPPDAARQLSRAKAYRQRRKENDD